MVRAAWTSYDRSNAYIPFAMMDFDHLSPAGPRSPLTSSNSSCPDPNPTPRGTDDYNTLRPQRACEYCRLHKVRCDVDPRDPSQPCGRCLKANRDCVSSSHPRKRRKTTDSRVLELERKVERLTSRLDALEQKGEPIPAGGKCSSGAPVTPALFVHPPPATSDAKQDVIDLGILDIELAGCIFQHFVVEIAPIFPGVIFPPNIAPSDIRRQKPTLFLAILVTASGVFDISLQRKLQNELLKVYSDQIMYRGVRSLELVQALIVSALWYYPPENMIGNNLNQFIHLAAVMASDIAITKNHVGKRPHPSPNIDSDAKLDQQWGENFPAGAGWRFMIWGVNPDSSLPECRRALLSCYFLCTNMARLLRRPSLFPFTRYMAECIEFFESSNEPGILNSDRIFVQWIKILRIDEEFGVALGSDETRGEASMLETRGQIILETFLGRITKWRQDNLAAGFITPALDLYHQSITKHMYDLTLHSEHNTDDFRPLYFETLVARSQREPGPLQATKFHDDAMRAYLTSVHSCLDSFLEFSPSSASSLPSFIYIEIGYSIGLLVKILFAVVLSRSTSRVLRISEINFSDYVERLINFLATVTEHHKRHAAERLRLTVIGLKGWVDKNKQRVVELSVLANKRPAPPFEQSTATTISLPPMPQTYMPSPQVGIDTAQVPFGGYPNASREEGGFAVPSLQDFGFGDPMMWDSFPLTEFLQLDGAPDVYAPWG